MPPKDTAPKNQGPADRRPDLAHCRECWTAFAPDLKACPHCGEARNIERN